MKNNTDVKVMWKEAGILFAITLLSGLLLGFVYQLTKDPIAEQEAKSVAEACVAVMPSDAGDLTFTEVAYTPDEALAAELAENGVTIGTVYEATGADGTVCGYVVESVSSEGYGGDIGLYVGMTTDGTVSGVSILDISETAGLGMRAPEVLVPQYAGKNVEEFTVTKNGASSDSEIDAISSATITSRAVTNAVNGAMKAARAIMEGGADNG